MVISYCRFWAEGKTDSSKLAYCGWHLTGAHQMLDDVWLVLTVIIFFNLTFLANRMPWHSCLMPMVRFDSVSYKREFWVTCIYQVFGLIELKYSWNIYELAYFSACTKRECGFQKGQSHI